MSTRRQIFKLWKLLSNERLLPRTNLKSRKQVAFPIPEVTLKRPFDGVAESAL
jgi:hypothetical protein